MSLNNSPYITTLRDKNTSQKAFQKAASVVTHFLAYTLIEHLETIPRTIETPFTETTGVDFKKNVTLIPILRSGIAMLSIFQYYFEDVKVGFIGMQRNEATKLPELYYANIPQMAPITTTILLDPMLATGNSASKAIEILIEKGCQEENIIFVALLASSEGLLYLTNKYPKSKIIIAVKDPYLNKDKFITPGFGDFGDRYFGTL